MNDLPWLLEPFEMTSHNSLAVGQSQTREERRLEISKRAPNLIIGHHQPEICMRKERRRRTSSGRWGVRECVRVIGSRGMDGNMRRDSLRTEAWPGQSGRGLVGSLGHQIRARETAHQTPFGDERKHQRMGGRKKRFRASTEANRHIEGLRAGIRRDISVN